MGEFAVHVAPEVLDDLRDRLGRTRWAPTGVGAGWDGGVDRAWLRDLVTWWARDFDWRGREAVLNRFPQYRMDIGGTRVHFLHVRGTGRRPLPLLLTHGWPSRTFGRSPGCRASDISRR